MHQKLVAINHQDFITFEKNFRGNVSKWKGRNKSINELAADKLQYLSAFLNRYGICVPEFERFQADVHSLLSGIERYTKVVIMIGQCMIPESPFFGDLSANVSRKSKFS